MNQARITAIGMAVPNKAIPNSFYETIVDTTDEWIVSRTGVQMRYHASSDEFTSDLCVEAVENMLSRFDVNLRDVDLVLAATTSPDQPMPGVACRLQFRLGLDKAGAFDLYAACAGFAYGIIVAKGLIAAGSHRKVLVVAGETLSKITDFTDRTSCVLFGDGAGAVLVEAADVGNIGQGITGAYGAGGPDLYISGFADTIDGQAVVHNRKIMQNGRKVFKWAVQTMSENYQKLLALNNMKADELNWFIPHSANLRILEAISQETGYPMDHILQSVVNYGNTSSASIPIAFCKALDEGRIQAGDNIMMLGFGGGLTYAGIVIRWM